jgi:hypothetical protein
MGISQKPTKEGWLIRLVIRLADIRKHNLLIEFLHSRVGKDAQATDLGDLLACLKGVHAVEVTVLTFRARRRILPLDIHDLAMLSPTTRS